MRFVSFKINEGKVEYFYDGNRDDAATLVCEAAVGEVISAYPDKSKAGYRFVRDTCPLAVGADSEGNVIRVYYERIKEKPPEGGNDKPGSNKPGGGPSKKPAMAAVDWHATGMGMRRHWAIQSNDDLMQAVSRWEKYVFPVWRKEGTS